MPWFQERRTRYTSCVPPIPTCSIWFAFNNSYFFCDSLVCYISSANMKASEVSEALKTWKVQKQVLQHCTWKKNVLCCNQNYWFNADLVFWKHRSNMDGWIQWSWSILGEHILQLSLCMLFWSQQPVLPMCMLHLLTRAAEVGSGESFFKHKRKQRIKKKKMLFNTSHPNSNSAEQLVDVAVSMANR